MKIVDYCESNKQMGRAWAARISIEALQTLKEERPAPREALIITARKMLVKEPDKKRLWVKNAHSKP